VLLCFFVAKMNFKDAIIVKSDNKTFNQANHCREVCDVLPSMRPSIEL
jgi:hypothetical protein